MSLYKYVVPERIDILRNASIRFSQPEALNDPFEMKPHLETLAEDDTIRDVFYTNNEFQKGVEMVILIIVSCHNCEYCPRGVNLIGRYALTFCLCNEL